MQNSYKLEKKNRVEKLIEIEISENEMIMFKNAFDSKKIMIAFERDDKEIKIGSFINSDKTAMADEIAEFSIYNFLKTPQMGVIILKDLNDTYSVVDKKTNKGIYVWLEKDAECENPVLKNQAVDNYTESFKSIIDKNIISVMQK